MKKIAVLMTILFCGAVCLGQQKPAEQKKIPPPKVDITKFKAPKSKMNKSKPARVKFNPPVIRKES